ncbi:FAD-binding protein [Sneathiella sp. P13V-1]|uniref:FAD-binding oxidoreductase n=1 Tax=Sneathiella sp. P13V-1 TaxID=2697366 RepID=UPI00187B4151|nr:FAD-binding oxidoreductase [Sneathiella sp. P13V-1]MBE7638272.1 FAD-binding protein [Sneathiella sp. P13V-1]
MSDLVRELQKIVGEAHVLTGEEITDRHSPYCHEAYDAGLLVRPETVEEVSAVCKAAKDAGVALVPHGGLTGLVEGTVSHAGDVIISFERMNKVLRLDPDQMVMVVEAGVTLQNAIEAAAEVGMMPGVDIPSRGSATIGGMTSTNAGGVRVLRYGMMRENILGLEAVLSDGTIISSLNTLMKNNAGFDLKQLFIGSEGKMGLVTKVALKLHPKPAKEDTALVATNSFEDLVKLLGRARTALGSDLLSFEAMWADYYRVTTGQPGFGAVPLPYDYPLYGIIETAADVDREDSRLQSFLEKAFEDELVVDAVFANSVAEQQRIWRSREDSDALMGSFPVSLTYDIGFELKDMDAYAKELTSNINEAYPQVSIFFFGHMGDGNLHIMVGADQETGAKRESIDQIVYACAADYQNSTLSAEHGIGLEKKAFLHTSRSPEEIALMHQLVKAMGGNINAGKVI